MIPSYEKCWHRDVKEVVEVGEEGLDHDVHVLRFSWPLSVMVRKL